MNFNHVATFLSKKNLSIKSNARCETKQEYGIAKKGMIGPYCVKINAVESKAKLETDKNMAVLNRA